MDCKCSIKGLLDLKETRFIKELFARTGRKAPESEHLVALGDTAQITSCPFHFSWGFSYYCANPEIIKQFAGNK